MEKSLKRTLPTLVRSLSDFVQVDLTIKLFGVTVFSFTWPPKNNSNDLSNNLNFE